MVLDGIDGRVARWTNTQSEFGAEYDSLADMVSFGAAPALIAYEWALKDLGTARLDRRLRLLRRRRRCASRASTPTSRWSTSATSRACPAPPARR